MIVCAFLWITARMHAKRVKAGNDRIAGAQETRICVWAARANAPRR